MKTFYENGERINATDEALLADEIVFPDDATDAEINASIEFAREEKISGFTASGVRDLNLPDSEKNLINGIAYQVAEDIVRRFMMLVVDSEKPKKTCDILASTFGIRIRQGISKAEIAARHGVSKQDINNSEKRLLNNLGLKKVITRSSKQPSKNYAKNNYRSPKKMW